MKNITVGIFETLPVFGKRLAGYISGFDRSPFIVCLYLEHPAADLLQLPDVMIVTGSLWPVYRELAGGRPVLLLDEEGTASGTEGPVTIYKYQSAAAICRALTDLCLAQGRWRMAAGDAKAGSFEVWGIYTPARTARASREVENYLTALAGRFKTLCISLEPVYTGQRREDEGGSFSEVIYFLKQKKNGLGSRIAMMAAAGVYDLILPAALFSEVMDLSQEEWERLLEALREETSYERIVFDLGSGMVPAALFGCLTQMKLLRREDPWEMEIAGRMRQLLGRLESPEGSCPVEETDFALGES